MLVPLVGRHIVHSMAVFYTALVCTSIFQTSLLGISVPQTKTDWLSHTGKGKGTGASSQAFGDPSSWQQAVHDNKTKKSLALLFPPGIVGGYRNQVMRLIGFLQYAKRHDVEEILLPTMLWTTTYKAAKDEKRFFPVPMASLFDIDHWNSFPGHLPLLVESIDDGDCWEPNEKNSTSDFGRSATSSTFVTPMAREILESSALLTPVKNISHQILTGSFNGQTRKLDLLPQVENCSRPLVYGGGRGAGRLWNDYVRMTKAHPGRNDTDVRALESSELISVVSKALRPKMQWREVAHKCVEQRQRNKTNFSGNTAVNTVLQEEERMAPYVAVHARIEVDMMVHRCSKNMEKNLTNILEMVDSFQGDNNYRFGGTDLQGIFLAVSRHGMQQKTKDESVQALVDYNWGILNSIGNHRSNFFECGEEMLRSWYSSQPGIEDDYYGSLLPSILNFYIATQATVFVGVSKSSFSTDVWTTRYYQGKGDSNFEYTRNGVFPIAGGGLPPPHRNC